MGASCTEAAHGWWEGPCGRADCLPEVALAAGCPRSTMRAEIVAYMIYLEAEWPISRDAGSDAM